MTVYGKRGDHLIEAILAGCENIELRVLARRGDNPKKAKLIATIHLTADEAHDLGWELRAALLERRWHEYPVERAR